MDPNSNTIIICDSTPINVDLTKRNQTTKHLFNYHSKAHKNKQKHSQFIHTWGNSTIMRHGLGEA
jgi:hypothetical protein